MAVMQRRGNLKKEVDNFEIKGNLLLGYDGDDEDVAIPDGIEVIGYGAFYTLLEFKNTVKRITIPNSVTTIEDSAFRNCNKLVSINIPERATLPSLHPQNNYSYL